MGWITRINGTTTVEVIAVKYDFVINDDLIIWPAQFNKREIIPQSKVLITYELSTINEYIWIAMTCVASLGIVGLMVYVIYIGCIAKKKGIKTKSNIKLNLVIYTGVVMAYVTMIICGLDERKFDAGSEILDIFCNIRAWFLVISFTLIFTPIFAKTYKLSRIFTELLITKTIPDKEMLIRVGFALCIDLLLLVVFVCIGPFERDYTKVIW